MRKVGMALVGVGLVAGTAAAREDLTAASDQRDLTSMSDQPVQTHRLDRWGFDARGPSESDVAYRACPAGRLVSVNSRRTTLDWTAVVLTAGWYTPAHTTVRCAR
jgi:hypothetical protein